MVAASKPDEKLFQKHQNLLLDIEANNKLKF